MPRTPTYTVGGVPPYGFVETPPYDQKNVPIIAGVDPNNVMYEQLGYRNEQQGGGVLGAVTDAVYGKVVNQVQQNAFTNPGFLGVGSVGSTPPWMRGEDGQPIKRILRGYLRRETVLPFGPNATQDDKFSNARLLFMYNPESLNRNYLAYDSVAPYLNATLNPNGIDQANVPLVSYTYVQFVLFFDREAEVASIPDHPGCLLDLAVFDALARGGSPGQTTITDVDKFDASAGAQPIVDASTLSFDPSKALVAIFSPSIAYRGTISEASARFEKFSHRMVPTRMELSLTLKINYFGPPPKPVTTTAAAQAAAAQAAKGANVAGLDPEKGADTQVQRDAINQAGRSAAMSWGVHWIAGGVVPGGVIYNLALRTGNVENDSYENVAAPHIPTGFDCSSFVARCFGVIGWDGALGITTSADTNAFEAAAAANSNRWTTISIGDLRAKEDQTSQQAQAGLGSALLNQQLLPGDCLLRSGSGAAGHIAFVYEDMGGGPDPKTHQWRILHANESGKPVNLGSYTSDQIIHGGGGVHQYDKVLRATPVQLTGPGKMPDAGGGGGGGSW